MSLYTVRDRSFDERQFADVLEYLDAYVLAQMLADLDMKYDIISGGQNHMGNIHQIVVYSRVLEKGFKLDLYENQTLRIKGVFHVQAFHKDIDKWDVRRKIQKLGLTYDFRSATGRISYAVKLTDRMQYQDCLDIFKDLIP